MKLEDHKGSITIEVDEQGKISLTYEESFEVLAFLYMLRDRLYQAMQHPGEQEDEDTRTYMEHHYLGGE